LTLARPAGTVAAMSQGSAETVANAQAWAWWWRMRVGAPGG
jgi:hypothetical protein